jgi:acetyltransferase
MIKELRAYPLLLGVRGEKTKDIAAVVNVIVILGAIISHCREISDIEINPLVVYEQGDGVRAVDIRIILTKNEERWLIQFEITTNISTSSQLGLFHGLQGIHCIC